jgi:hypothetical protein
MGTPGFVMVLTLLSQISDPNYGVGFHALKSLRGRKKITSRFQANGLTIFAARV